MTLSTGASPHNINLHAPHHSMSLAIGMIQLADNMMSIKEVSIIFEIDHLLKGCWIIGKRHKIPILG